MSGVQPFLWFLALGSGCIYISDADLEAFYDRDGDGLDHALDCDDRDASVGGRRTYWPDVDGDGFGDGEATPTSACALPEAHAGNADDCDDADPSVSPVGVEVCDPRHRDEDCNGVADDADAAVSGRLAWYPDGDGDTFGDAGAVAVLACVPPENHVSDASDCDDTREDVYPGADEICDDDNTDEDCDGQSDDGDIGALDPTSWYPDNDEDGFGDAFGFAVIACDAPAGHVADATDCDDARDDVNPGADEVCDDEDDDEDCDGASDDLDVGALNPTSWYPDGDGDGFGDEDGVAVTQCDPPAGFVADASDCDDAAFAVNPSAVEICDPLDADEDCDGLVEGADPSLQLASRSRWYVDEDRDGYGDEDDQGFLACDAGGGFADSPGDCDDGDPLVNPGVTDSPGDGDKDCDGVDYVCGDTLVRVPGHYPTIQAAVDAFGAALCDGDIIEVLPGTFVGSIDIQDVSPVLRSVVGPAGTILDGGGSGRVVNIERSGATLEGFTIRNGSILGDGGGVRVFFGDGVVLRDLVVHGNAATNGGGLDLNNPTDVIVDACEIRDNTATNGGGLRINALGSSAGGEIRVQDSIVRNNIASNQDGGVRVSMSSATPASVVLDGVTITGNVAVDTGGLGARTVPDLQVYLSEISDNTGTAKVGGAFTSATSSYWESVTFAHNTTSGTLSALQAEAFSTGGIDMVDVVVEGNVVNANGYAVLIRGSESFGATLRRVTVGGNTGHQGASIFGGGISVEGMLDASNVLVFDNTGFYGMQIAAEAGAVDPATHVLVNATLVGNAGDGLLVSATTATSILVKNVISAFNGGYGIANGNVPPVVSYSDSFSNSEGAYSATNPTGTNGNLSVDPVFESFSLATPSSGWNLALALTSPLIDAGDPTLTDVDGSTCDMGWTGGPDGL